MKLINGMEPERYLASLLLANSSYKGEKYYEKEDEYTEIIKKNKHLLVDNNDNEYEEDDGDKKYNIYEYKNLTPKQLREMYRNVTGLNNDEEFTNQEVQKATQFSTVEDVLKQMGALRPLKKNGDLSEKGWVAFETLRNFLSYLAQQNVVKFYEDKLDEFIDKD